MGAQALALMMEREGCGEGKKKDLKVEKSEGMQIPAGVEAHVIIPGIPERTWGLSWNFPFFFFFLKVTWILGQS